MFLKSDLRLTDFPHGLLKKRSSLDGKWTIYMTEPFFSFLGTNLKDWISFLFSPPRIRTLSPRFIAHMPCLQTSRWWWCLGNGASSTPTWGSSRAADAIGLCVDSGSTCRGMSKLKTRGRRKRVLWNRMFIYIYVNVCSCDCIPVSLSVRACVRACLSLSLSLSLCVCLCVCVFFCMYAYILEFET